MDEHDDIEIMPEGGVTDPELGEEGQAEAKVKKLREELTACRKEKQTEEKEAVLAQAVDVSAIKSETEEKKQERGRGTVKAVEALLPALDALERAKEHGEAPPGFASIAKQLENAFASLGLESIGEVGERFDPALHEALGQDQADSPATDGTVNSVLERGWRMGEALVRPAKVRVAHLNA